MIERVNCIIMKRARIKPMGNTTYKVYGGTHICSRCSLF
jgi:hypothetical protein